MTSRTFECLLTELSPRPRRVMAAAHATPVLAATNKCLAQSNKPCRGREATKKRKLRSRRRGDPSPERTHRTRYRCGVIEHIERLYKEASTMKFVLPEACLEDYKKRRNAFLKELIASTPNVSVRAKEFRRWIDKNSSYNGKDEG